MKRYLLDLNVLLDLHLKRLPWATDAAAIWAAHKSGQIVAVCAAFSVPTIFYIIRQQTNLATAQTAVNVSLGIEIAATDRAALLSAEAMPGSDFEDNLQIACAGQARLDGLVTPEPRGFAAAPIPVLTPADLVAALSAPPTP